RPGDSPGDIGSCVAEIGYLPQRSAARGEQVDVRSESICQHEGEPLAVMRDYRLNQIGHRPTPRRNAGQNARPGALRSCNLDLGILATGDPAAHAKKIQRFAVRSRRGPNEGTVIANLNGLASVHRNFHDPVRLTFATLRRDIQPLSVRRPGRPSAFIDEAPQVGTIRIYQPLVSGPGLRTAGEERDVAAI